MPSPDDLLWTEDVAELTGLSPTSVRVKLSQAGRRRQAGDHRPSDLPAPDGYPLRTVATRGGGTRQIPSPQWKRSTIEAWLPRRRGRGNPRFGAKPLEGGCGCDAQPGQHPPHRVPGPITTI